MDETAPIRLERKIGLARAALGFERLWAALLWPIVGGSVALALVLSGWLGMLPAALRWGVLVALALGLIFALRDVARLVWPGRAEATQRIEAASHLAHRPVSGLDDRLPASGVTAAQQAIWQAHRERQLAQLVDLRVGTPRSAWRDRDQMALRVPAAIALLVALVLAPLTPGNAFRQALMTAPPAPPPAQALDAWIKPPAYTGQPPVMLTSPAMQAKLAKDPELTVPEGSVLSVRLAGATAPRLVFQDVDATRADAPEIKVTKSESKLQDGLFTSETKLARPALVRLIDGETERAAWHILILPDTQPTVAITEDPTGDSNGALTAKWKVTDDYGVTGLSAEIVLSDQQDDGLGIDGNGIFMFEPPKFPVALHKVSPRLEEGKSTADLAEHPWAGFMAEMVLTARDAAGHVVKSEARRFRMPERVFIKPLARALIEQRKALILKPDDAPQVADMLDLLGVYPRGLFEGSGAYLMVAAIISRIRNAGSQDDIDVAVKMLWDAAVGIEEGLSGDAKAELNRVKRELDKAIAEGAPQDRINKLMEEMRQAMDRYFKSLEEEARKQHQNGGQQAQGNEQTITSDQLQKMLDGIERRMRQGDMEGAQQLLSQLDDILRNLKPGQQQAGGSGEQGDRQMGQMLNGLSDLMKKQQRLMDRTQRLPQPGENQPDGMGGNDSGTDHGQQNTPDGLAGEQGDLGQSLDDLMRKFGENGLDAPSSLGDAGRSMKDAQGSLKRSDKEGALLRQGEALNKLREGAQNLARQLMQQGQGQQGTASRTGEGRGLDDRDPLGRPRATQGEDRGPNHNILPSERAAQRAREILDALRQRMGEPQLTPSARSYIERLLRGLY